MKRLWIGVITLAVLLILGAGLTAIYSSIHTPLSQTLEKAAAYAQDGDLQQAAAAVADAQQQWESCRDFSAAVVDHRLLEEMDELFAQLNYTTSSADIAALCARLASRAADMAESQSITWWNLL